MHAYPEETERTERVSRFVAGVVAILLLVAWAISAIVDALKSRPLSAEGLGAAVLTCLAIAITRHLYRKHYYRTCTEIRLSDDGLCEFETRRRVIRLHANQVKSVKYRSDDDDDAESYTIRWEGGRVEATDKMIGFRDFLVRLRRLNPSIDLTSFPATAWPELGLPTPARRVRSVISSWLFPLFVISLLVWLAIQTLTGN